MTTSTSSPTRSSAPAATDSDKLVDAMEKTDYVGTIGRIQFLPKGDPHVHGLKTGAGFITGLILQWQNGEQVNLWPADLAKGKLDVPVLRQDRARRQLIGAARRASSTESEGPSSPCGSTRAAAGRADDAVLADPDRRLRDLLALCAGRDRLHADLRRHRRAQPFAWRDHGRGGGRRLGRLGRFRRGRLSRRAVRRRRRAAAVARDLFSHRPAAAIVARDARGGEGDLHPHRDAALGHHDPGGDRLSLHQQRQDRAADRRGRGHDPGRAHAGERDFHRRSSAGRRSARSGCSSTARAPARRCSPRR